MKIAYINQTLGIGGAEVLERDLLAEFVRRGHEVRVFLTNDRFIEMLKQVKISAQKIPVVIDIIGDWKGLIKAAWYLPKAIWTYYTILLTVRDCDVIYLTGFPEKIIVSHIAKRFNIPVAWVEYADLTSIFDKFFGLPKFLYFSASDIPKAVATISHHGKKQLNITVPGFRNSVVYVKSGRLIDLKRYKNTKSPGIKILDVSRLQTGKGQDYLLHAFISVKKKHPLAELIFVGEGDFEIKLKEIIQEYQIKDVRFTGWVSDSIEKIAQADICVFPSVWPLEGFGLVMIEAMALGKCVIAFDHPPANEVIIHRRNGLLAKSKDIIDLAEKINLAIENSALRNKLGHQASRDFQTNYTIETAAEDYLSIFSNAYNNSVYESK